jgi:hypothetical protein
MLEGGIILGGGGKIFGGGNIVDGFWKILIFVFDKEGGGNKFPIFGKVGGGGNLAIFGSVGGGGRLAMFGREGGGGNKPMFGNVGGGGKLPGMFKDGGGGKIKVPVLLLLLEFELFPKFRLAYNKALAFLMFSELTLIYYFGFSGAYFGTFCLKRLAYKSFLAYENPGLIDFYCLD